MKCQVKFKFDNSTHKCRFQFIVILVSETPRQSPKSFSIVSNCTTISTLLITVIPRNSDVSRMSAHQLLQPDLAPPPPVLCLQPCYIHHSFILGPWLILWCIEGPVIIECGGPTWLGGNSALDSWSVRDVEP